MSTPKTSSSSTGKWLSSKKERRPLQQLYLTPPNFAQYTVCSKVPKWKDAESSTQTPISTKQATLDRFLTGDGMPPKSAKRKIKGQSAVNVQINKEEKDSIETITPSPPKEDKVEDKIKGSSKQKGAAESVISPLRRSARLTQRSRFTQKGSLKLTLSPPLPIHQSKPLSTSPAPPLQIQNMFLPINTRKSEQQPRSGGETSPSYHTAVNAPLSSVDLTPQDVLILKDSAMVTVKETMVTPETEAPAFIKEVPSSLPWENTPTEGWADAWPSSQESPRSSQNKTTPTHPTQPQYNEGFRVPDPPSSKHDLDDTQDDSQTSQPRGNLSRAASLQQSPPKPTSQHRQTTTLRIPEPITWSKADLDETQDDTQDDTQHESPILIRKRKREPTILEIPDSEPSDDSFSQLKSPTHLSRKEEHSLILLSQAPVSMLKQRPEIIHIHSTQSQSQESLVNPQLSESFARTSSDDSQNSHVYPTQHNWASSQPTQSSIEPMPDINLMNPPSQMPLSSQNDLSRIPEPLAMILEHGIVRRRSYEDWVNLDDMERQQDLELQQWERDTRRGDGV